MHDHDTITVHVVYPSATKPMVREYKPTDTVQAVKEAALVAFNLEAGVDPANPSNRIEYFIYFGRDKINNLNEALGALQHGEQEAMEFRLLREIVVG